MFLKFVKKKLYKRAGLPQGQEKTRKTKKTKVRKFEKCQILSVYTYHIPCFPKSSNNKKLTKNPL